MKDCDETARLAKPHGGDNKIDHADSLLARDLRGTYQDGPDPLLPDCWLQSMPAVPFWPLTAPLEGQDGR